VLDAYLGCNLTFVLRDLGLHGPSVGIPPLNCVSHTARPHISGVRYMFDELQTWWQSTAPETQAIVQAVSLIVVAIVGGHYLGGLVERVLRVHHFDAALRLPGSPPATEPGITPTLVAGLVVRLTVAAMAISWLARKHGRDDIADTLRLIMSRSWALAAILVAALTLASLLARRLIECLSGMAKTEAAPSRNEAAGPRLNPAGVVGAGTYVLVVLFVLLIAADLFDWPLTRTSAVALWQLAQHLLIAIGGLVIGCLGARWASALVNFEETASPEKRAAHYTALGIIATSTILAVAVLLSSAGILLGLAALAVLSLLLWLVRGYLPDVIAGLQLRQHNVREAVFDGEFWQLAHIGFLTTQLGHAGEFCYLQNRLVLQARLHGSMTQAAPQ
jgi:hypothetical protein